MHDAFLLNIKYFRYKIGIQFNNTLLVIEEKNHVTKIVNAYIVYDLYNLPKIPLRTFTLKSCFFLATNVAKNIDKSK